MLIFYFSQRHRGHREFVAKASYEDTKKDKNIKLDGGESYYIA